MMRKKAMLAQNVGDYSRIKSDDWPLYVQPKLDGVRCLIQAEGLTPYHDSNPVSHGFMVKAYSRTGKEWKNIDHILDELHPFFAKNRNVILDGELYNHDLKDDFEKIISLVRKTKPTDEDRLESAEMVQFHCYDTVMEHMDFRGRHKFIRDNFGYKPREYACSSVRLSISDKSNVESSSLTSLGENIPSIDKPIYTPSLTSFHTLSLSTFITTHHAPSIAFKPYS